jgi:hypothetical protein
MKSPDAWSDKSEKTPDAEQPERATASGSRPVAPQPAAGRLAMGPGDSVRGPGMSVTNAGPGPALAEPRTAAIEASSIYYPVGSITRFAV